MVMRSLMEPILRILVIMWREVRPTTTTTTWNDLDCDGDGVTNGDEIADGTDPQDPCDYCNGGSQDQRQQQQPGTILTVMVMA